LDQKLDTRTIPTNSILDISVFQRTNHSVEGGIKKCRRWFTTHLIRAGMARDFMKDLRGDVRDKAIDSDNRIDKKEFRESYLAHMPHLGI
jgi:hypothetical protein